MKESYIEGLANHDDRKPCVGVREGVGEASVAARAGRAIEPRKQGLQGADAVSVVEGNTDGHALASAWTALRGLRL